jgi:hypothetical protein
MSATFPENYRDLFQKNAFGAFATLMPDGSPQTTPVWIDWQDGEYSNPGESAGIAGGLPL